MFIYKFKYEEHSEDLVKYEMSRIFGIDITQDYILTKEDIDLNKSYFLHHRIEVKVCADTIDQLVTKIAARELYYEGFKIEFIDVKSDFMDYSERIEYCKQIANVIGGYGVMREPKYRFVITYADGKWYFGNLERNPRDFERLQTKPHTYSHSMSCELSRTLINILCGRTKPTIIDPCCGIGTVVAEALDLGYDITGTELNPIVAGKCKENLLACNMQDVITNQDMHTIDCHYDVSILDIPYGLMSKTDSELQTGLVAKCYEISDKLLLVANENCDDLISNTKWQIADQLLVPKANFKFKRYVYILTK